MNVLILYAHPSCESFNAALRDAAADEVRRLGHNVEVSDLYAQRFDAVGGPDDFQGEQDTPFHYQSAQRSAALAGTFVPAIAREQEKLRRADCLILQFPIWWGGPPAIIKGWIDRVCAYGVAYADGTRFATGLFRGRRSLISVTTGGSERRFSPEGEYGSIDTVLWPIQNLFLGYLGFELASPHVCYSAPRIDDAARIAQIDALRARVRGLVCDDLDAAPIPSSRDLLEAVAGRDWSSAV